MEYFFTFKSYLISQKMLLFNLIYFFGIIYSFINNLTKKKKATDCHFGTNLMIQKVLTNIKLE